MALTEERREINSSKEAIQFLVLRSKKKKKHLENLMDKIKIKTEKNMSKKYGAKALEGKNNE